jgi:hypothetical protein
MEFGANEVCYSIELTGMLEMFYNMEIDDKLVVVL